MSDTLIRPATQADLPGILAIYNHAVQHTTAIWNETTVDLPNRLAWFEARIQKGFPVLVAQVNTAVAGYASYGDWRPFEGFRHTVEHSIYVHPDHQGQGLGKQLLHALISQAQQKGVHVMIAAIDAANTASIGLHAHLGFRQVGTFSQVGVKFGRWLDLTCMELRLDT